MKRFPEKLGAIEREAERVVQLAREAKEIAGALKQLLEKEGKTLDDEKRIAELYAGYVSFLAESGRVREAMLAADRSRATTLAQRIGQAVGHSTLDPQLISRSTRSVVS